MEFGDATTTARDAPRPDIIAAAAPAGGLSDAPRPDISTATLGSASPGAAAAAPGNLPWVADIYGGVCTHTEGFVGDDNDVPTFRAALAASLDAWRAARLRGVWLPVPAAKAALIPVAIDAGFVFHHCMAGGEHGVMLCCWLPTDEPNRLPNPVSHYAGVGGLVQDSSGAVLVVSEKYAGDRVGVWKLPGGLVNPGETLQAAVEREVLEETGVACAFEGICALRHATAYVFGSSDLYFVCRLRLPAAAAAPGAPPPALVAQAGEIASIAWMPLREVLTSPLVTPLTRRVVYLATRPGAADLVRDDIVSSTEGHARDIFVPRPAAAGRSRRRGARARPPATAAAPAKTLGDADAAPSPTPRLVIKRLDDDDDAEAAPRLLRRAGAPSPARVRPAAEAARRAAARVLSVGVALMMALAGRL
jgi:ADP-ribose pyrophosphatase YjhB (NUDIX family)